MKFSSKGKWRLAVEAALLAGAAGSCAAVATSAVAADEGAATELDSVTVTGSRISRTTAETASPVEVLSRADIENSGKQNIAEILQTITANNQGSIPAAFTSGFASGSAAVSLRGLGVNSTLVLLNGRRIAPYGLADDGQRSFVDLNTIPLEAVERVEVLKDGASAIYGSDAIAGVVNIILRKDYQGASLAAYAGTSYLDDGDTARINGSFGIGNLESDGYNAFMTVEGSTQDRIGNTDRSGYLATTNLSSYGLYDGRRGASPIGFAGFTPGSIVNPYGAVREVGNTRNRRNINACPEVNPVTGASGDGYTTDPICLYDTASYNLIQPDVDRFNLLGGGTLKVSDTVQAFTSLGYFYSEVKGQTTPSSVTGGLNYNQNLPSLFNPSMPMRLPAGHPDNPFEGSDALLSYMTADFGPRTNNTKTTAMRAVVGLEGALFSTPWKWGTGFTYSEVETEQIRNGYILFDVMQTAVNNGFRIGQPSLNTQEQYEAISPTLKSTSKNELYVVDANVNGPLFSLPAGQVMMAVGAEYRTENYDNPPTPFTETGAINGLGYSSFKDDRDITAGYVELIVPVTEMLELNGAYRFDHYTKYGDAKNPKVGFKLQPSDKFAVRGTYAEGFRAPGPGEGGEAATFGYTGIALITAGNPDIKPETSKSYTAGIVAEPLKGLSVTLDYYLIKRDNEIIGSDSATVLPGVPANGTPGSTVPGALDNSFVVYDDQGDITAVYAPYVNANKTKTDGLDANIQQTFKLALGTIKLNATWTQVFNFERELEDGSKYEYAGTHGPYVLSAAGGTPSGRGAFSATFERSNWTATARVNYVSGMKNIDYKGQQLVDEGDGLFFDTTTGNEFQLASDATSADCGAYTPDGEKYNGCRVGSFTTLDLFGKIDMSSHWTLSGSILNFLNKEAPLDPYTYGGLNYNPVFHQAGAVGRYFTLGLKYTF